MEIELHDTLPPGWKLLLVPGLLLFLVLLGWVGQQITPATDVFTWLDYQVWRADRQYRQEQTALRREAETLHTLLTQAPHPVRAQLQRERVRRVTSQGLPALSYARTQLLLAADAVEAWAVGAGSYAEAVTAVARALQALLPAQTQASPMLITPWRMFLPLVRQHDG